MSKRKANIADDLLLNKVVLRPEREHARFPEMLGRSFESFTACSTANGQLVVGWYFPADKTSAPLALLNSSNRGTKADALDHAALLLACGCGVLLYDYQGFGDSAGLADVRTLVGDAEGVLNWAAQRAIWSPQQPLILVGLSLGSLVAVHLAAGRLQTVRALVLDGAIEPFRVLRRSFGPLGAAMAEVACLQVPDELNSEKQIPSVASPVLFIHGRNDSISPPADLEHLARRATHPTLWVLDDCDHLDIIVRHPQEYQQRLCLFLEQSAVR